MPGAAEGASSTLHATRSGPALVCLLHEPTRVQEREESESLRRLVRDRHVHYDVDLEWMTRRGERSPSGFEVRFFAAHERGARALPACEKSRALASLLRQAAERLLPPFTTPVRYEFEPFVPVLYESRALPGTDEVAVTVRVFTDGDHVAQPADDPALRTLRARLRRLGIPES